MQSWIPSWFKEIAYSIILLRREGYPCIFYGDYYGIQHDNIEPMENLKTLLLLRRDRAYGEQVDYFDNENIIGWVREGDKEHKDSGLVVIMSDNAGGSKQMNAGENLANCVLVDITGNMKENVYIDKDGNGIFYCDGGSVSIWVKK